jgi:mevalonate kinase
MSIPLKSKTTGNNIGFGKVILFGEHFVVHGTPAIVAGVTEYTDCILETTPGKPGYQLIDNRPAVPGYKTSKAAEQAAAYKLVFDHLKIDLSKVGLKITIAGPLAPSSGMGASASDCVALSRALSEMYGLNLDEHAINFSAFTGEGGYHGTPSGVDNTAATFGGLLQYQRGKDGAKFARVPSKKTLYLVVASTGITASTTKVVGDVRKLKESQPELFKSLVQRYQAIYDAAASATAAGDLAKLGQLMTRAHALMQQLTVSCKELDTIVATALEAGALGAKMSGTGRGGIAIALCESAEKQAEIAAVLKARCPEAAKFIWQYKVTPAASSKL